MEDILVLLFAQFSDAGYGLAVLGWCFFCAVFTALAPVKWTEKIPDFLMVVINLSALNFKNASNKLTNLKGNPASGNATKDT